MNAASGQLFTFEQSAASRSAALLHKLDANRQHPEHPTKGSDQVSRTDRAKQRHQESIARGITKAQQAMHAAADHDDDGAIAILAAQPLEDLIWCANYLLTCLRATVTLVAAGDPAEAARRLHEGANKSCEALTITQAEVIVNAAFNKMTEV